MNTLRLEDGLQEADYVTSLMIIALIVIGDDSKDLLVELKYIKAFSDDELYEKIDECQCLAHIETAIEKLLSGTLDQLVARKDSTDYQQGTNT